MIYIFEDIIHNIIAMLSYLIDVTHVSTAMLYAVLFHKGFLWIRQSVFDLQESFHRGGTIKDITDQICSLNANLHSYDSPTQLVVDKYMKEHGLDVEPEEEEFGYGKLLIDYKPPKKATSKISNKGKCSLPV